MEAKESEPTFEVFRIGTLDRWGWRLVIRGRVEARMNYSGPLEYRTRDRVKAHAEMVSKALGGGHRIVVLG